MSVEDQVARYHELLALEIDALPMLSAAETRTDLMFIEGRHLGHLTIDREDLLTMSRVVHWQEQLVAISSQPMSKISHQRCQNTLHKINVMKSRKWALFLATGGCYIDWQDYWARQPISEVNRSLLLPVYHDHFHIPYYRIDQQWYWLPKSFDRTFITLTDTAWPWFQRGHHARYLLIHETLCDMKLMGQIDALIAMDEPYLDQWEDYLEEVDVMIRQLENEQIRVQQLMSSLWWLFSGFARKVLNKWLMAVRERQKELIKKIADQLTKVLERDVLYGDHLLALMHMIKQIPNDHAQMSEVYTLLSQQVSKQNHEGVTVIWQKIMADKGIAIAQNAITKETVKKKHWRSLIIDAVNRQSWHLVECVYWSREWGKSMFQYFDEALMSMMTALRQHPFWLRVLGHKSSIPKVLTLKSSVMQSVYLRQDEYWQSWLKKTDRIDDYHQAKAHWVIAQWQNGKRDYNMMSTEDFISCIKHDDALKKQIRQDLIGRLTCVMSDEGQYFECEVMHDITVAIFQNDREVMSILSVQCHLRAISHNLVHGCDDVKEHFKMISDLVKHLNGSSLWIQKSLGMMIKQCFQCDEMFEQKGIPLMQQIVKECPSLFSSYFKQYVNHYDQISNDILSLGAFDQGRTLSSFQLIMSIGQQGLLTRFQREIAWRQCLLTSHLEDQQKQSLLAVYEKNGWDIQTTVVL